MSLKDFLEQRSQNPEYAGSVHVAIAGYRAATKRLIQRIEGLLGIHRQLELEDWNINLKEQAVRYEAPGLSVRFGDVEVLVMPKGTFLADSRGRVTMECGAKLVLLDWQGGEDDWTYWWSVPSHGEPRQSLTDEAIETLIEELLA